MGDIRPKLMGIPMKFIFDVLSMVVSIEEDVVVLSPDHSNL